MVDDVDFLIEDVHELVVASLPPGDLLRLEEALWLLVRVDVDLHEGFDEALDGLLVGLILHGVLVDQRHDALLQDLSLAHGGPASPERPSLGGPGRGILQSEGHSAQPNSADRPALGGPGPGDFSRQWRGYEAAVCISCFLF